MELPREAMCRQENGKEQHLPAFGVERGRVGGTGMDSEDNRRKLVRGGGKHILASRVRAADEVTHAANRAKTSGCVPCCKEENLNSGYTVASRSHKTETGQSGQNTFVQTSAAVDFCLLLM